MQEILQHLDKIIKNRKEDSTQNISYVSSLYNKGLDAILKKIAEEAGETIMASKDAFYSQQNQQVTYEVADLWFHSLILMHYHGLSSENILAELKSREGISGISEKNNRYK